MSDRVNNLTIPISEVRPLVLEAFKGSPQTQYRLICNAVASIAVEMRIAPNPRGQSDVLGGNFELNSHDEDRVREIIWNLVVERVVTIGNAKEPAWPFLSLTEYGSQVVNSVEPIPHDPSGYLRRTRELIPNIDPIIIIYLEESLSTYNINALLSSTIALGCASEKALLLLIDSYTNAIEDPNRKERFIIKTNGKMIKHKFEVFSSNITNLIGDMPTDVSDGLNTVLLGVFEMIRNNRNDAGHPTGKSISREHVFANLQVFIPYCRKIYKLIDYFDNNRI